ncbi:hypothetical protein BGZ54_009669 [Gamsiella multidivaricata]|nr:hypothetical protein BGZ54_009669 [Gamsiella multidivaricata]
MNGISSVLQQETNVAGYDGLIMVEDGWELTGYEPYQTFLSGWLRLNPQDYPGAGKSILKGIEGMAYSCVVMVAKAYGSLIRKTIRDPDDRVPSNPSIQSIMGGDHTKDSEVVQMYQNNSYKGPNVSIILDENGEKA